jgi:hypothetical protein
MWRRRLATLAALAVAGALGTPAAHAGTYTMYQCRGPAGEAPVSDQWTLSGPAATSVFYECASNRGFGFTAPGPVHYQDGGGIGIDVPSSRPNVTITRVASAADSGDGQWSGGAAVFRQYSGSTVYAQNDVGMTNPSSYSRTGDVSVLPGTRSYDYGFFCGGNGQDCATTDYVHAQRIWWVTFTLNESAPPGAAATGGSLVDGSTATGTERLTYVASDADSGVSHVVARLGDTPIVDTSFGSQCPQTDFNACPNSVSQVGVDVDTAKVPDGTWPLYFDVTDAAGNAATGDSGKTVTTANGTPNPAGSRSGGPGGANVVRLQARAVRKRFGAKITINQTAVDSDGKPAGDTDVTVLSRSHSDQDFVEVGKVHTGDDGAFSYEAPTGPNRTLEFRYRAGGADYALDVPVEVRAGARLGVSKERIHPGTRVVFRGQLLGGPFPARGVPIGFRGKVGRHTRRFGDQQTDAQGRFRLRYRFRRDGPNATYPVWVHVGADGSSYPYLPGTSNRVKVKVRR